MDSKPRRTDGLDVNRVSEGYVIYREASEVVHYLNPTGAFIFELCDGETPIEWMADLVREAFDLDLPPTHEVSTCLSDLHRASLIEYRKVHERTVRLLGTEMRVMTDDDELARALEYVLPHAEQAGAVTRRASFVLARHARGFELRPEDGAPSVHPERAAALAELSEQLHRAALEPYHDAARVHAALGSWNGRAFLLIGGKGSGKTTLLLRLLFDGAEAHGDELVLIRAGEAVAFPRKLYIKQGTLEVVPELAQIVDRLPAVRDAKGAVIRAFEPRDAGRPWRIEPVRPAAIVALEPGFDGESRIEPLAAYLAVERVLSQSSLPTERTAEAIRDVCALVDGCRTWRLQVGHPATASRLLRESLDRG